MAALRELRIDPAGGTPPTSGGLAYRAGQLHALPGGAVSLLSTGLLGVAEKLEFGRLLTRLPKLDTEPLNGETLAAFLAREVRSPRIREVVEAVVRLTCYAHAPERISAGAAIAQLVLGLNPGVRYLDGGWQSMVDAVVAAARAAGAELRSGVRVDRVEHDGRVRWLALEGGESVAADAVILALGPDEASQLVDGGRHSFFARAGASCSAVRAACLDLGLARLPVPKRPFALGIDRPLYFSVHSASAKLAPEGAALVQVARYLGPDEQPGREELETEFERMLDVVQPGWREVVVTRKLLRDVVVTHDLPQAARGGLRGRTPGQVTGVANLWLAGDWIGPEGMLVDGVFASARLAARAAAESGGVRVAA